MVFWVRELGEGELLIRVIYGWEREREKANKKTNNTYYD